MRGGLMPPALLFIALGLALAFASRRARVFSLLALFATLGLCTFVTIPQRWLEGVFLGCWISVASSAASVHVTHGSGVSIPVALSINAGVWASAVVSVSGSRSDLLVALPDVFIFLPASWITRHHSSIPVKVVSSWVIAVATLAAFLQWLPVTPGYLPDHLE